MATRKITITVEQQDLARIREMVQTGTVTSVSGFVQQAVTQSLDADRLLNDYLAAAIAVDGPLTTSEVAWLDDLFPIPQ